MRKKKRPTAEVVRRRAGIKRALRKGHQDKAELAAQWNVSLNTISTDISAVLGEWEATPEEREQDMGLYVARLLSVYALASDDHEISRKGQVTIKTVYTTADCPDCDGTGMGKKDRWCRACGGDGEVTEEQVTRTVTGTAGDAAHLRVMKDVATEICKLHGHYPDKKEGPVVPIVLPSVGKDWTPQMILEGMAALERIQKGKPLLLEAESVPVPGIMEEER